MGVEDKGGNRSSFTQVMAKDIRIQRWMKRGCLLASTLLLSGMGSVDVVPPTLQDILVAGRVLQFRDPPSSGEIVVAIVFDVTDASSRDEANATAALFGRGQSVGDLILRPKLIEQKSLAASTGYGVIFTASGVNEHLLAASLKLRGVPCLTRHLEQVEHGACTVAICSNPRVSIVVNSANAAMASTSFAIVFRMMVREI